MNAKYSKFDPNNRPLSVRTLGALRQRGLPPPKHVLVTIIVTVNILCAASSDFHLDLLRASIHTAPSMPATRSLSTLPTVSPAFSTIGDCNPDLRKPACSSSRRNRSSRLERKSCRLGMERPYALTGLKTARMMYVLYTMLHNAGGVIWTTRKYMRLDQHHFAVQTELFERQSFPGSCIF